VYDTTVAVMGAGTPSAHVRTPTESEITDAQILGIAGS
jgi:hypothetical protein